MKGIVDIQLRYLERLLKEKDIAFKIDDKAKDWLAKEGYDSAYGARPLKRVIQRSLQNELASQILEGRLMREATISANEGGLEIQAS